MPTRGKLKPTNARQTKTPDTVPAGAPALSLNLQFASQSPLLPTKAQLRRWVKAALQRSAQITIRIVDAAEAQALNKQFRGKDYATNVLTFVYDVASHVGVKKVATRVLTGDIVHAPLNGDIVLCAPVVAQEAAEQGKSAAAHYAHLTVHGVLHLQGYDHERHGDAKIMEKLEIDTLGKLGYADPYHAHMAGKRTSKMALHL